MNGGPVVRVREPEGLTLVPGASGIARFVLDVADGFHAQANPATQPFLIPLTLKLRSSGGLRVGSARYPPGRPHRLEGAEDALLTYDGTFEVAVPVEALPAAPPGERSLRGSLRYQACDDRMCLFPVSSAVTLTVRVVTTVEAR